MTPPRPPRPAPGFTLLELLVAMAIFAVVGVLALSGYTQLQKQSEYAEKKLARLREVQHAVQTMAQDFEQLEPRPIRQPIGDQYIPAIVGGYAVDYKVEFTRAGWSNTAGLGRPTLQRVAYRLDQDGLWRDYWLVLDRTQTSVPVRVKLLTGVRSVSFRYMDGNRAWSDNWPEQQQGGANATVGTTPDTSRLRPAAVEFVIELQDWGKIRRVVEVPG